MSEPKCRAFEVRFDCDNAAFDEHPASEVASILRRVAEKVREVGITADAPASGYVRDSNGNVVGRWAYYFRT